MSNSIHNGIKIVLGGGGFGRPGLSAFQDTTTVQEVLDVLVKYGVRNVDTAQHYGNGASESLLGNCNAGQHFVIDTKSYGGAKPGSATEEGIVNDGIESLGRLKTKKVDVWYIHAPDPTVPISSTLAGINALHKRGSFERFGLSNYTASEVRKVYDHCKEHGYVLPSVFQGHYNPISRHQETLLFPTLRKLGISFYAYSPLAGGFLTKTKQDLENGVGRFDKSNPIGMVMHAVYARPSLVDALEDWAQAAQDEGCTRAELAYRWIRFNSPLSVEHGDALIIGPKNPQQAEETLKWLTKGPLSEKACKAVDAIWEKIKHEAPVDVMEGLPVLQGKSLQELWKELKEKHEAGGAAAEAQSHEAIAN